MILNHLIIFYNVFENSAATRILFFKIDEQYHSALKTFLVYINKMPLELNDISLDDYVIKRLRNME